MSPEQADTVQPGERVFIHDPERPKLHGAPGVVIENFRLRPEPEHGFTHRQQIDRCFFTVRLDGQQHVRDVHISFLEQVPA